MKKTRLFRVSASVLCLALVWLGAGGTLAGCKEEKPATLRVEPPGLPIVLASMSIRTETFNPEELPEQYRQAEPREGRAYYLVHMNDLIRSSWVQRLAGMNLGIEAYLPYNTLILGMTPDVRQEVARLPFVKWIGLYQPYFKLSADVQALGLAGELPQVDVTVFDSAAVTSVAQEIAGLGMQVLETGADTWRGHLRVALSPALLPKLAGLREVEWIEPAALAVGAGTPQVETAGAVFPLSLYGWMGLPEVSGVPVYGMNLVPWAPGTGQAYLAAAAEADRFAWDHADWWLAVTSGDQGADSNGDGRSDPGTILPLAAAKNVLTAGTSEASSGDSALAPFSGRGPAADGRIKPDLAAPAEAVRSIAGKADYVRRWLIEKMGLPGPSSALLRAVLIDAAAGINPGDADMPAPPDFAQGWGSVETQGALGLHRMLKLLDNREGMGTGETRTYKVDVSGEGELRVALAWTDYPSVPEAGINLVNDLDLRVIGPGGVYYYPNGRSSRDPLNNLERVVVPLADAPGEYTIEITAANVPLGPQPFALVAAQF